MEKGKKVKLLIDLICTSKLESNFEGKRPSFEHAAYVFADVNDFVSGKEYQYLKEFDGYDSDNIESLQRSQESVQKIIDQKVEKLENFKPEIKNQTRYRIRINDVNSEMFKSYCKAYNKSISKSHRKSLNVIDFPAEVTFSIKKPLIDLAKALIKLDVIETVLEEIELEGKFNFKKEFKSVPDACRFYEKESGLEVTRDNLKDWLKNCVIIQEEGEEIPWDVINKRINAWVDHENKKPNRKTISHK